jgi:hypothetical protein
MITRMIHAFDIKSTVMPDPLSNYQYEKSWVTLGDMAFPNREFLGE